MALLTIKKVGNHWYPDIQHEKGSDISLDFTTERFLNLLGTIKGIDSITFCIEEVPWIINESQIIYVNEEDLTRYYVTDDDFLMRLTINNIEFELDVYLYYCLSQELNLNLHTNMYQITLYFNYEN